jgi:hypothetical protein
MVVADCANHPRGEYRARSCVFFFFFLPPQTIPEFSKAKRPGREYQSVRTGTLDFLCLKYPQSGLRGRWSVTCTDHSDGLIRSVPIRKMTLKKGIKSNR